MITPGQLMMLMCGGGWIAWWADAMFGPADYSPPVADNIPRTLK